MPGLPVPRGTRPGEKGPNLPIGCRPGSHMSEQEVCGGWRGRDSAAASDAAWGPTVTAATTTLNQQTSHQGSSALRRNSFVWFPSC
ncbi:hypothetical protein NHX12_005875 [Muraenolepis orangiensis]|uniref:Uncharacterized protein n=1 Tax=Muraenolepis orangiensis TaxID=630683 RepID=A0A9Q0DS86_9TELE|nr:hypothetical protein NHX12_005875 [Muraenolepis orangiensis]